MNLILWLIIGGFIGWIASLIMRTSERCRQQSLSILVPMGQEMAYRYQEALMADLLYALRAFRERLGP